MNALLYFLHNESSAPELTDAVLETWREDFESAYDTEFAPRHAVLPISIKLGTPTDDCRVLHMVDEIPEAPGALAYHTVDDQGRPTLRLGVNIIRTQGGNLLDEISIAITHEIFETAVNPFVRYYCQTLTGPFLALEVCDPVQGGSWRRNHTAISNFVLPAYFDAGDMDGPYDYLGVLKLPFSVAPGGYQAWSDGTQTFGKYVAESRRRSIKEHGRVAAALRNDLSRITKGVLSNG